jgi:hypothetical protein
MRCSGGILIASDPRESNIRETSMTVVRDEDVSLH